MDKNLEFLTKLLVDEAILIIDKNGIPPKREGKGYAVSIGKKQYPFKLIVTEAAKIVGINLTSKDFSSSKDNRNGFQELTDYTILSLGEEMEYSKFKKLLEYFVAHLEWVVNNNDQNIGFEEYILPLIEKNKFKRSGQGYAGANIQLQIKEWQTYTDGQICINVQANFGDYKSAKSYLNWLGTGLNIIANWSEGKITSLYQEEYLHWEKNPTRKKYGKQITLSDLGLFDKNETVTSDLIIFFESFKASIVTFNNLNANRIMTAKLEPFVNLIIYKKQIILQGPPGTGKTKLANELAYQLLDNQPNNEQLKLIQFHPSYTYEDFVRGIVAKPNIDGSGIVYQAENNVLGKFAEEALENYLDSKKDNQTISREIQMQYYFEEFKEYIFDKIEESNGFYELTNSVGLITTDDKDAFRYKGKNDGWVKNGNRMLFKDVFIAFNDENKVRQDIKKNRKVSGLARQHASYFIRVVNKFQDFIKDNKYTFDQNDDAKIDLKNYVLIIDEINRANLSSVLGELIYALEYRGKSIGSIYEVEEKKEIILPPNLYIIGTMNTADRSVGHIDYAIRRRFAFVDVFPKNLKAELGNDFDESLFVEVANLFIANYDPSIDYSKELKNIRSVYLNSDFDPKDVWLGHSYFIKQYEKDENGNDIEGKPFDFNMRLDYEIKPILLEYVKDGILKESAKVEIEKLKATI